MSAYGDRKHLYFPPGAGDLLSDIRAPIVLVEAEKSALALTDWCRRTNRKMLPVATGGAWGWRGRVGKVANEKGWRVDEVGPITDLDYVDNRECIVLFDTNATTNANVQAACASLIRELQRRECRVLLAELPQIEGINGPDDYIGAEGDAAIGNLLDAAKEIKPTKEQKQSQATAIVELAAEEDIDFFHTRARVPFCTVTVARHRETMPVRGRQFRNYLTHLHFQQHKIPGTQALKDAVVLLEGRAMFDGPEREVHVRVAGAGNHIYLDLGNDAWQVVEITADGWEIITNPPVRFRRSDGMYALPTPVRGGTLHDLRPFLNVDDEDDFILIQAWLLAAIRPTGPYPILDLVGEHGTAKSTASKILRRIIDPFKGELRAAPHDERDLVIAAANSHVVAFDNFSRLEPWLSDAMCRLATGGGLSTRQLYTDDDEMIFEAQRPQMLNSIEDLAVRGDFADRAITIQLNPIKTRRPEDEFWQEFEAQHPRILGALLDAVSFALRQLPTTKLERLPRMADFALWATSTEPLLWAPGKFMEAYSRNRGQAHEVVLEDSLIAPYLLTLAEDGWFGTTQELLDELNKRTRETKGKDGKDSAEMRAKSWPKSPHMLAAQLRRLAPTLRTKGVEYVAPDRRTKARQLSLEKVGGTKAPKEPTANPKKTSGSDGPDMGAEVNHRTRWKGTAGADAAGVSKEQGNQERHHVNDRQQSDLTYGADGADVPPTSTDFVCPGCGIQGDWSTQIGLARHMATCPEVKR